MVEKVWLAVEVRDEVRNDSFSYQAASPLIPNPDRVVSNSMPRTSIRWVMGTGR